MDVIVFLQINTKFSNTIAAKYKKKLVSNYTKTFIAIQTIKKFHKDKNKNNLLMRIKDANEFFNL